MDHALDGGTGLANQAGDTGNGKVMGHGLHNSQPLPWQQNSAREYLKMLNLAVRPYREHAYQALRQAGLPALLAWAEANELSYCIWPNNGWSWNDRAGSAIAWC